MISRVGSEFSGHIYLETNSFRKLFKKYFTNKINIINNNNCQLIISSPLSGDKWNTNKKPYIYWSGESRYPNRSEMGKDNHIYVLSFFPKEQDKHNTLYIPFCLESRHIYKPRIDTNINRKWTIGYCASNKVQIREDMFNKFVKKLGHEKCRSFGTCYGSYKNTNQSTGGDYQGDSLIAQYRKCKFVLAMENSKRDGYVTEKIVNAFYSGAIPIYWGSSNISDLFNKDAFINVDDFPNLDACVEYVTKISDEQRLNMLSKSIYNAHPTKGQLINILNDSYNSTHDNKVLKKYQNMIKSFISKIV